jgi:hypothetical protein
MTRGESGPGRTTPHDDFLGLFFCLLSQQQVARLIIDEAGEPYRYVVTPNAQDPPHLLATRPPRRR